MSINPLQLMPLPLWKIAADYIPEDRSALLKWVLPTIYDSGSQFLGTMGAAEALLENDVEKLDDFILEGRHQVWDHSTLKQKHENNPKVGNLLEPIYQTRRIQVEHRQNGDLLVWWDKCDKSKAPSKMNFSGWSIAIAILDSHPTTFHEDHRALFVCSFDKAFYVPFGSQMVEINFPVHCRDHCEIYVTGSTVTFLGSRDSGCYGYQYPVKGPFDRPQKEFYVPGAHPPLHFHKEENRLFYVGFSPPDLDAITVLIHDITSKRTTTFFDRRCPRDQPLSKLDLGYVYSQGNVIAEQGPTSHDISFWNFETGTLIRKLTLINEPGCDQVLVGIRGASIYSVYALRTPEERRTKLEEFTLVKIPFQEKTS